MAHFALLVELVIPTIASFFVFYASVTLAFYFAWVGLVPSGE